MKEETPPATRNLAEEDLRAILDASPLGIMVHQEGRFVLANPSSLSILRARGPEEVLGRTVWEFVPPEDVPLVRRRYEALHGKAGVVPPAEYRVLRCDGTIIDVEMLSRAFLRDGSLRVITLMQDITPRKRTETALRQSEERYRLLFELESDAILLIDREKGTVVEANRSAAALYGAQTEGLVGLRAVDLSAEMEITRQSIQSVQGARCVVPRRLHRKRDGTVFPVEISVTILDLGGRETLFAVVRDLSERERTEEELVKAHKLESLAVLAGGIAHDFNNLLTGIMGNISLARTKAGAGALRELLEEAEAAADRAKAVSNQLLTFSRGGDPVRKVISLRRVAQEGALLCTHGSNVACRLDLPRDLWPILADEGQVGQVVRNIVLNGVQAIRGSGEVRVGGENRLLADGNPLRLPAGPYSVLRISDSGGGIPPGILGRIFDPFFTTREKGQGLGLAICHSIVSRHGGKIEVSSTPGKGSSFEAWFPAIPSGVMEEKRPAPWRGSLGAKKVLVIDDEEMIRRILREMLENLGCRVAGTPDGRSGLAAYLEARRDGDPFDLVIIDLTIPGGSGGQETLLAFREEDPGVTAVVTSGYGTDPVVTDFASYGFAGALLKPFRFEDVRNLMGLL